MRLMIYGCAPFRPERREEADLLYNQGFRYQLTNLPFDWVIAPVPNASVGFETQAGVQVMNVDFFGGRVKFEHVSHLLNLAPGSYRFQGRERAQALQNERGLQWRICCVDGEGENLGTTDPLSGDIPMAAFRCGFHCSNRQMLLPVPCLGTPCAGGA